MTYHYFNQPDSACIMSGDLLNNHQKELGGNTLNMAILLGMNPARSRCRCNTSNTQLSFTT